MRLNPTRLNFTQYLIIASLFSSVGFRKQNIRQIYYTHLVFLNWTHRSIWLIAEFTLSTLNSADFGRNALIY